MVGASPTCTQTELGVWFSQPVNNRTNLLLLHLQFCEVMSVLKINWNKECPAWDGLPNQELLCCLWSLPQFECFLSSRPSQCTMPSQRQVCSVWERRVQIWLQRILMLGYNWEKKGGFLCVSSPQSHGNEPRGIQQNDSGAQVWITTAALEK